VQGEHKHQREMPRVKVSWQVISACCPHVAREMVVPGKELKGGSFGPTSAPAEGSKGKPCLAFGHPVWSTKPNEGSFNPRTCC